MSKYEPYINKKNDIGLAFLLLSKNMQSNPPGVVEVEFWVNKAMNHGSFGKIPAWKDNKTSILFCSEKTRKLLVFRRNFAIKAWNKIWTCVHNEKNSRLRQEIHLQKRWGLVETSGTIVYQKKQQRIQLFLKWHKIAEPELEVKYKTVKKNKSSTEKKEKNGLKDKKCKNLNVQRIT